MREHAYAAGESVYDAVDATRTFRVPPTPSTHNLGTTRMSARPEDGVVNEFGRAHDVPNLFVSDGSVMTTGADREPDVDDRRAGPAPGRPYRAAAESGDALVDVKRPGCRADIPAMPSQRHREAGVSEDQSPLVESRLRGPVGSRLLGARDRPSGSNRTGTDASRSPRSRSARRRPAASSSAR